MNSIKVVVVVTFAASTVALSACTTSELEQSAASSTAPAGSLAGNAGNVRRYLPRAHGHGVCPKVVEQYIAASGHSAYASTDYNRWGDKGFICGASFNRKTTADAEARALASCEAGVERWKYHYNGKCRIHASK